MKVKVFVSVKGCDEPVVIERFLDLPFTPWVGLEIYGLTNECSNLLTHTIEAIWWDHSQQHFVARFSPDDSEETELTSQEMVDEDYPSEWSLCSE